MQINAQDLAEVLKGSKNIILHGAPGTGKTHTIANLVGDFLAKGKSVLVTSYTKKALSVLKDKLPKNMQSLCVSVLDDSNEEI